MSVLPVHFQLVAGLTCIRFSSLFFVFVRVFTFMSVLLRLRTSCSLLCIVLRVIVILIFYFSRVNGRKFALGCRPCFVLVK